MRYARRITPALLVALMATVASVTPAAGVRQQRFISTSGIPHHDVAAGYGHGVRSMGRRWRVAIDTAIGQIASENPDEVLHGGDMVGGRWGQDVDRPKAGVFGPTGTHKQRIAALRAAGDFYYRQNKRWWARHGLDPHFGIGDHEYGDLGPPKPEFNARAVPAWRDVWSRHFVAGRGYLRPASGQHAKTAYATMLEGGRVGLVSLDPVARVDGVVRARIGRAQMAWLDEVLDDLRSRGADFLIVQSEIPARGPNRAVASSRMLLENGDALWDLLAAHGVDLLLSGEFHDMTTHTNDGRTPVQVVHGGQLYRGTVSYLRIDVHEDRLTLRLRAMDGTRDTASPQVWAPSRFRARRDVRLRPGVRDAGTMTIWSDGRLTNRSGRLREGI
ncbi:MAG TPA: hypothetical protein VK875_10205 [Euzebyales bacterium]|nr:hypothetical protein [Euzebyales bacterium]